jgi:hypothetical protein
MGIAAMGMLGSLSGNLAPMIAALFAPRYLAQPTGGGSATNSTGVASALSKANTIVGDLNELNPITGPVAWITGEL